MRHVLDIDDLSAEELRWVLDAASQRGSPTVLDGDGVALVFEKPSARTRNSMEMAVTQLGGHPVTIRDDEVGIDVRETAEDVARTLGCYHAVLAARVYEHDKLVRMAAVDAVPIVNMLSDAAHPLQALADLRTLADEFGPLEGRSIAYVGDANNVARSLVLATVAVGMDVRVAAPAGYGFSEADRAVLDAAGARPLVVEDPAEAVAGVDAVYTDVWTSMGQEDEAAERRRAFAGYTVDEALMAHAGPDAIFLHCLPAHRGEEVDDPVLDGPRSRVWPQATNRMHAARGLLWWLAEERGSR
ncbi:MAG: ornithine carbamoyltransferase [Acidimicrobiia bacterium]|nr:ornithine carbamoyltransferase [Acidimicrobiia bacterium]